MKCLFAFSVLLATGLAAGYQDLPNVLSLGSRQIHTSPHLTSSQTSNLSPRSRISKRSTCTGEHCLFPRKQASPSPSPSPPRHRNNNNNNNRASTPGNPRNRHIRHGITVPVLAAAAARVQANSHPHPPASHGNSLAPLNPNVPPNRASTPVPAPIQHPANGHAVNLRPWRGSPSALPLHPTLDLASLGREAPLPLIPSARGIAGRHGDAAMMPQPHEPIIFGHRMSAFQEWHQDGTSRAAS